jgi:uncharacterized protein YeaO (DUF488 family)
MIRVKRVYDLPEPDDMPRRLVDRPWPRSVKKERLPLDGWHSDVATSNELRKWFGHDPTRWDEFKQRHLAELDKKPDTWSPLLEAVRTRNTTLLYGSQDSEHNNAAALKAYLETRLQE